MDADTVGTWACLLAIVGVPAFLIWTFIWEILYVVGGLTACVTCACLLSAYCRHESERSAARNAPAVAPAPAPAAVVAPAVPVVVPRPRVLPTPPVATITEHKVAATTKECTACGEIKPGVVASVACGHHFCFACIADGVEGADAAGQSEWHCSGRNATTRKGCDTALCSASHMQFTDPQLKHRTELAFLRLMMRRRLDLMICPNNACRVVLVRPRGNEKIVRCTNCRTNSCTWCLRATAGGATARCTNAHCKVHPSLAVLKTCPTKTIGTITGVPTVRLCPNCSRALSHADKCKHMECVCKTAFCFSCLKTRNADGYSWPCGGAYSPCPTGVAPRQTVVTA